MEEEEVSGNWEWVKDGEAKEPMNFAEQCHVD
jgi:hypothetical protein